MPTNKKIHFNHMFVWIACSWGLHSKESTNRTVFKVESTKDWSKVTCGNCKRSKEWRRKASGV